MLTKSTVPRSVVIDRNELLRRISNVKDSSNVDK